MAIVRLNLTWNPLSRLIVSDDVKKFIKVLAMQDGQSEAISRKVTRIAKEHGITKGNTTKNTLDKLTNVCSQNTKSRNSHKHLRKY
jgi:hypothetical protein